MKDEEVTPVEQTQSTTAQALDHSRLGSRPMDSSDQSLSDEDLKRVAGGISDLSNKT